MPHFKNKSLKNSLIIPPNLEKIQNKIQDNSQDNSNLENSADSSNYSSNNRGKIGKNKKLQKINWQKSHRKNDKKPKFKKYETKYENNKEKNENLLQEKILNHNNYKTSQYSSQTNLQTKSQIANSEPNNQSNSFPSFYPKKNQNLSKFQNNIQNIAQNINSQINQIPNKINQNLSNFEHKNQQKPEQKNPNQTQFFEPNSKQNQNLDQFKNYKIYHKNTVQSPIENSNENLNSQNPSISNSKNSNSQNNLDTLGQKQSPKFQTFKSNLNFDNNSNNPNSPNNKGFIDNSDYPISPFFTQDKFTQSGSKVTLKSNLKPDLRPSSNFINSDNYQTIQKNFKNNSTTIGRQFAVRHTYRAGAIVWVKYRGENYYVVFRSLTRPSRGIQLPGGRIERMENVADAVTREVYEEIGIQTRILCPLGYLFTENPTDNFSRMEIYYIVRPIFPIDVFRYWKHQDLDEKRQVVEKRQTLECWCVPCTREVDFLSFEQGKAVLMFRDWLNKHKKLELEHTKNF